MQLTRYVTILVTLTLLTTLHVQGAASALNGEVFVAAGTTGTNAIPSSRTTNVTISATSKVTDGASAVAFSLNSSNALSTSGAQLLTVGNGGTNKAAIRYDGGYFFGSGAFIPAFIDDDTYKVVRSYDVSKGDTDAAENIFELQDNQSSITNHVYVETDLGIYSDPIVSTAWTAVDALGSSSVKAIAVRGGTMLEIDSDAVPKLLLWPDAPASTTPSTFDTPLAHTSGNLMEVKNNGTLEGWLTYNGISASTNGIATGPTDTAVTIAATGWTNTFGKNAVVYLTGTNTTYTVFDNAGTAIYTNLTTTGVLNTSILLQPAGKVTASGTAVFGRACPF